MKKIQERVSEAFSKCATRYKGCPVPDGRLQEYKEQAIFEMLDELAERDELKIQMIDDSKRGYLDNVPFGFNKRWRAEKSFIYWYITDEGYIDATEESNYNCDEFRYNTGNYYKTGKEAELALEELTK